MKKRLGVIFGGRSGEHEIAIRSARTVVEQADPEKYEIVPVAITNDGVWLSPDESAGMLGLQHGQGAEDARHNAIAASFLNGEWLSTVDVVFPVLHGTFGEDGTIQGLLEMADVPYVGCGVLASSTGMDKAFMKTLFRDAGLPICDYVWFLRDEWEKHRGVTLQQVESKLGFPCFVKPANLGSSVGVSKAVDSDSLAAAISLAAEYDRKIIAEECIEMREIECAVMGNDSPQASLPGEYIIRDKAKKFLDYTEKYSATGNNEFVVPAPVSDELAAKIGQMAVTAFKAIDGSGLARVDFFLRTDNAAILVNEINTMPGLTDASGFPKMWAASGKPFPQVIDELVELAIDRHADKKRNRTDH